MTTPRLINSRIWGTARLGKSWQTWHNEASLFCAFLVGAFFLHFTDTRNLHQTHCDFGLQNKLFKFVGVESNFLFIASTQTHASLSAQREKKVKFRRWADSQWVNYFGSGRFLWGIFRIFWSKFLSSFSHFLPNE